MLIDVNCYIGRWPFVSDLPETVDQVAEGLVKSGITQAHVASMHSFFVPDPAQEERKLRDEIAGHDLFQWSPIIRPDMPNWRDSLKQAADDGAKLIKLAPGFHQYEPDDDVVVELVNAATALNIRTSFIVRMEDERRQHPLCRVPSLDLTRLRHLAEQVAPMPLLVLNVFYHEITGLADQSNLCFDLSYCEYDSPAPRAVAAVGNDRVLFGTSAPLLYAKAQQMKLDDSVENDAMRNAIAYENFVKFLG